MKKPLFLLTCLLLSGKLLAAGNRINYDLNGNGLIEIMDLADLNEIRNSGVGATALYGSSAGCPSTGCTGYELANNLDFDANKDGIINSEDPYWNDGAGWKPIENFSFWRPTVFDGKGYTIKNLYINRPGANNVGLFNFSKGTFRNIGLIGKVSVTGGLHVGAVLGYLYDGGSITGCYATGKVIGSSGSSSSSIHVGGIVGFVENSRIKLSFFSGSVSGSYYVGGVVGLLGSGSTATAIYSTAFVSGDDIVGGLLGYTPNSGSSWPIKASYFSGRISTPGRGGPISYTLNAGSPLDNNYWASDAPSTPVPSGPNGATLAQLKCTVSANDSTCAPIVLFKDWDAVKDSSGKPYWKFGTALQLPYLVPKAPEVVLTTCQRSGKAGLLAGQFYGDPTQANLDFASNYCSPCGVTSVGGYNGSNFYMKYTCNLK